MNLWFLSIHELDLLLFFKKQQMLVEKINEMSRQFKLGNSLCFLVEGRIAALSKIEKIDGNQVTLRFQTIIKKEDRKKIAGNIREILVSEWQVNWEEKMKQYELVSEESGELICQKINEMNGGFAYYTIEIDYLIEQEEKKHKNKLKRENKKERQTKEFDLSAYSEHTKVQFYLKELAHIIGFDCWMASNDKNTEFKGEKLGEDCMGNIPDFSLDKEAKKGIGLIDTIWFHDLSPKCAFEVETTTSVYSGLLRFADMLTVMPTKEMKFYIVAPKARKSKVMKELNRPIFKVIGMNQYCRYLSTEELEILYFKLKGLNGYVKENVLDSISHSVLSYEKEKASF